MKSCKKNMKVRNQRISVLQNRQWFTQWVTQSCLFATFLNRIHDISFKERANPNINKMQNINGYFFSTKQC